MRSELLFGPPPIVGSQWVTDNLKVIRKAGPEWDCLCPYHEDTSPSFRVNVRKGVWFCHTCHVGGTLNKLATDLGLPSNIMLTESSDDIARISDPPEPRPESYLKQFTPSPQGMGWAYWRSRGFTGRSIRAYDLGHDRLTGCVTYPMRDTEGGILGVVQRRIDGGKPKYKYPFGVDASKYLFGFHERPSYVHEVFIVEGALDAMLLWQSGYYAVAIYGSYPHQEQADLLAKLDAERYVIALDNDAAGKKGARELWNLDPFGGAEVCAMDWPEDVNDFGQVVGDTISLRDPIKGVIEHGLVVVWEVGDLPS